MIRALTWLADNQRKVWSFVAWSAAVTAWVVIVGSSVELDWSAVR